MITFTCVKDYGSCGMLLNQEVDDNETAFHPSQLGQFPEKSTVRCTENRKEIRKRSFIELEVQYLYIFF
jgi:hypothetical protein